MGIIPKLPPVERTITIMATATAAAAITITITIMTTRAIEI
jgi:hypothetical protein